MRNLCNNKNVSKLPHLSKFLDDISGQPCKKHIHTSTTVKPRYNAVSGRHLLKPRYKRGAL